jgi:DNA-binding NtrC family response regulator
MKHLTSLPGEGRVKAYMPGEFEPRHGTRSAEHHASVELRPTHGIAVIAGPAAGLQHVMTGPKLRIGKAPGNDLCLPDPTVSRFHCVLERSERGLLLHDLDSSNGTHVAGCSVQSAFVQPESVIRLGQTVLKLIELDGERMPVRPAQLLGASVATTKLVMLLPQLARAGATVLLEGETGTGKSMVAELIHRMGPRASGPFVVVDGGALAPSLIESELFGHERGSFTGASARRMGAFEAAQGGTVFLDEIGELPLELQPKLLRALEERVIRPVGGTRTVHLDVQVIAATNRDLRQAVQHGSFRADLYYRLEALRLTIPPLRERREDVPALVAHFCRSSGVSVSAARVEALQAEFSRQSWPGNVRELRNAVERALLLGVMSSVDAPSMEPTLPGAADPTLREQAAGVAPRPWSDASPTSFRAAKEAAVAEWERDFLERLMRETDGNISRAARLVHVDRGHLRDLLRQHGIAGRDTRVTPISR